MCQKFNATPIDINKLNMIDLKQLIASYYNIFERIIFFIVVVIAVTEVFNSTH